MGGQQDTCCEFTKKFSPEGKENWATEACKLARAKGGRLFHVPRVTSSANAKIQQQIGWCQAGQCEAKPSSGRELSEGHANKMAKKHFKCDHNGSSSKTECESDSECVWNEGNSTVLLDEDKDVNDDASDYSDDDNRIVV